MQHSFDSTNRIPYLILASKWSAAYLLQFYCGDMLSGAAVLTDRPDENAFLSFYSISSLEYTLYNWEYIIFLLHNFSKLI
jgi:hypothetical protein